MTAPTPRRAHTLRVLHAADAVGRRIDEMAGEIVERGPRELTVVAIAEGGRRLARELAQRLESRELTVHHAEVRAHRTRGTQLREVQVVPFDAEPFAGRDVLLVDDIADGGHTLAAVRRELERCEPSAVATAVLVEKLSRREVEVGLDHVGFTVDDGWVVGMGMDLNGEYRDLDVLAVVEFAAES